MPPKLLTKLVILNNVLLFLHLHKNKAPVRINSSSDLVFLKLGAQSAAPTAEAAADTHWIIVKTFH